MVQITIFSCKMNFLPCHQGLKVKITRHAVLLNVKQERLSANTPKYIFLQTLLHSICFSYTNFIYFIYLFIYCFIFLRAAPEAYGSYQPRGQIGAVAASLCHRHSKVGSEPCL